MTGHKSFPLLTVAALLALSGPSWGQDATGVKCAFKMKYSVFAELPTADLLGRYRCEGTVLAVSDIDATNVDRRQVVFDLGACRGLPPTVVFGGSGVTEVRRLAGDRVRGHVFSGECKGCAMTANADLTAPRLDAGHFDATFAVKTVDVSISPSAIFLPAGKGHLSLRSEANDNVIVRGKWAARRCAVSPLPPIFCGGIAGLPCPTGMACVDWPGDDCDPAAGGADCIGMCVVGP